MRDQTPQRAALGVRSLSCAHKFHDVVVSRLLRDA
jgi:hypothetical protein